jgi:polar amino acid transport system substrate-binding protein
MKSRILTFILMLAVSVFMVTGCGKKAADDKAFEKIKEQGFFIVGLDDAFPPMGFRSKDKNEIIGFDIDLANEAAKRLGVKAEFKSVAWDGIIFSLNKGDIDVVWNGMTITEERSKQILFSKPYMNNKQIIMVNKDSEIKTIADLKGKIAGLQLGSSSEKALNTKPEVVKELKELKKYENNTLALMDLASKRTDAVIVDEIVGRWSMAQKPGVYVVLEEDLGKEEYGVGIRKTDGSLKEALDKVLDEIKNDETGDKISRKWFGENILVK